MRGRGRTPARLVVAVILLLPVLVLPTTTSLAAPTKAEVDAAKARLNELQQGMEVAVEQYDAARVALDKAQEHLTEAKHLKDVAEAEAATWRDRLGQRAVDAYTSMGDSFNTLLDAASFSEFSDRLEYMGAIAQSDTDLATQADAASARAQWAADDYAAAVAERQNNLDQMAEQRDQMSSMLDEAESLYQTLNTQYQSFLEAQRQALLESQQQETLVQADDGSSTSPVPAQPDPGPYVPPTNSSAAAIAVDAAKSVLGTQYVWAAADPSVGFDCSGLTSWAWAQAGVYIPHSSAAQSQTVPAVPLSAVQPGDLIFYYSPVSHVALYIGGGQIIHARHPGPGGEVQIDGMYSYETPVGAARPG